MRKTTPLKDGIRAAVKVDANGCWRWTKCKKSNGYGATCIAGKMRYVHRVAYEAWIGPIPDGMQIDHLCRVRDCCNPDHLEAVTQGVNLLRGESPPADNAIKTRCPRDHPYDEVNTWRDPETGWRRCRECNRINGRTRWAAKSKGTAGGNRTGNPARPGTG
jgi:hypothetical protein